MHLVFIDTAPNILQPRATGERGLGWPIVDAEKVRDGEEKAFEHLFSPPAPMGQILFSFFGSCLVGAEQEFIDGRHFTSAGGFN